MSESLRELVVALSLDSDNRRTYNQSSSANLSGNTFYVRDEQDIRPLAVEIVNKYVEMNVAILSWRAMAEVLAYGLT